MTSDEIRSAFLSFFEEKGHKIIPSSPLIPQGDPTLLLTTAGMVQIKPYFLGEAVPPNRRLASCQKCFRTTDIESVGDASHLTFFEMLGNFSVGDYFKQEAISWGWEFVTRRLGLSTENLWITVFLDDDEAFRYWREIGVPEQRILRFGEEDNFWGPAGNSGPCGPCSEIHYDFGEKVGCGKLTCAPNCGCGRFSEIWNLVFTQYNQDEAGQRTLLPKPNIDTGMGLERIVAAVGGKTSVYETDLFAPLLECIAGLTGKKYGTGDDFNNAMRVVAEHSRGLAFLIADGVIPSNEGRGYVLRRLLRRAALFGRRLGLDKPFLAKTAKTSIEQMGHIYPEIVNRRDFIIKVIELEEARFEETLSTGLDLIEDVMIKEATQRAKKISGKDAFRLYDTYGFPVELTAEIVSKSDFSVDLEGFEKEMEKQRERARAAHKFKAKEVAKLDEPLDTGETSFVGYEALEHKSVIVKLLVDGNTAETIGEGQSASLILDATPFYGEMGGQAGDTGEIISPSGRFSVTDTVRGLTGSDVIIHEGKVAEGILSINDEVQAKVDKERRLDINRNHTATHLLQFALRQVLGGHVQQRGSLVTPDRLRFDFSHLTATTLEEIKEVQRTVNEKIRQNLPTCGEETTYKKAIEEGAIALFDEKYGDVVRLMKIGEPVVSAELCGGTHVASTREIGYFHVISESGIGAGLRRIEAVTGRGAEVFADQSLSLIERVAALLETTPENIEAKLSDTIAELDRERKRGLALERELAKREAESLLGQAEVVNGVTVLVARVSSSNQMVLREMADLIRDRLKSAVIVLGAVHEDRPVFLAAVTSDLVARGYNAGDIVSQVARVAGGGGGGKSNLGQAGGKYKDKLDEALRLVKSLI
ncbi:alanine--tRNA ligase [Chloroflexota bacterium]